MGRREQSESKSLYHATLLRACLACKDEIALARKLNAPLHAVIDWLLGKETIPPDIFLRAVDIVLASSREHVEETDALLERIRQRHLSK